MHLNEARKDSREFSQRYVFIINQLAMKHRGFNLTTLNAFLDYEKVFDKVNRS